jgi:hypothetical protein
MRDCSVTRCLLKQGTDKEYIETHREPECDSKQRRLFSRHKRLRQRGHCDQNMCFPAYVLIIELQMDIGLLKELTLSPFRLLSHKQIT